MQNKIDNNTKTLIKVMKDSYAKRTSTPKAKTEVRPYVSFIQGMKWNKAQGTNTDVNVLYVNGNAVGQDANGYSVISKEVIQIAENDFTKLTTEIPVTYRALKAPSNTTELVQTAALRDIVLVSGMTKDVLYINSANGDVLIPTNNGGYVNLIGLPASITGNHGKFKKMAVLDGKAVYVRVNSMSIIADNDGTEIVAGRRKVFGEYHPTQVEYKGGKHPFDGFDKLGIKEVLHHKNKFTAVDTHNIALMRINGEWNKLSQMKEYSLKDKIVTPVKDSSFTDLITDWGTRSMIIGDDEVEVENFSDKFFMLEVDTDFIQSFILDTHSWLFINVEKNLIYTKTIDVVTGDEVYKDIFTFEECETLPAGCKEYFLGLYTTSSVKKKQALFVRKDNESETWETFVELALPGYKDQLLRSCKELKVPKKTRRKFGEAVNTVYDVVYQIAQDKAAKILSRISLVYTGGNTLISDLGCIAFYTKTFDKVSGMSDGASMMSMSLAKELFHTKTVEDAYGVMSQNRTNRGVIKQMSFVVSDEYITEFCAEHEDDIIYIGDRSKPITMLVDENNVKLALDAIEGKVDFKLLALAKATDGKGSKQALQKFLFKAALKGRLEEAIEYIVAVGKRELREIVDAVAVREYKDAPLGSNYIIDVLDQMDPQNITTYHSLRSNAINGFAKMINKLGFKFRFEDGTPSIYNAVVTPDLMAMLSGHSRMLFTREDGKHEIYYGTVSKRMGALRKIEAELLVKLAKSAGIDNNINDDHDKLVADADSCPVDAGLHYKQELAKIYVKLADLGFKFSEGKIIKYPTVFIEEYLDVVVVDSFELEKRIRNTKALSLITRETLLNIIWHTADAAMMFESDEKVYNLLAGMDNDYDKCIIIFDKFINEILDGNDAEIALSSKLDGGEIRNYDANRPWFMAELYVAQDVKGASIGGITIAHDKIAMMLCGLLSGDEKTRERAYKAALKFLEESVGETKGVNRDYDAALSEVVDTKTGEVVGTVDFDFTKRMKEEITTVEWSYENLVAFLYDCSKVFRLYQESAIDAAKTGEFVEQLFTLKAVILESNIDVIVDRQEDGASNLIRGQYYLKDGDTVKIRDNQGKVIKELKAYSFHDTFAVIQDQLIEYANEILIPELDSLAENFKYSEKDTDYFAKLLNSLTNPAKENALSDKRAKGVQELMTLRNAYVAMNSEKIQKIAEITANHADDTKAANREIDEVNNRFNKTMEDITATVHAIIDDLGIKDNNVIGGLLLAVGCYSSSKKTFNASSSCKFAYLVGGKYVYDYFADDTVFSTHAKVSVGGSDLVDGETVNLVKGVDYDKKIITESNYTGEAVYHTGNEYNYVQVDVDLETVKLSDRRVIVFTDKNDSIGKYAESLRGNADNTLIVKNGKVMYYSEATSDGGYEEILLNTKVNACEEFTKDNQAYYSVVATNAVKCTFDGLEPKLTYLMLTVEKLSEDDME